MDGEGQPQLSHLVPHVHKVPLFMDLASMDLGIRRTCERSRGQAVLAETSLASLHLGAIEMLAGVEKRSLLSMSSLIRLDPSTTFIVVDEVASADDG